MFVHLEEERVAECEVRVCVCVCVRISSCTAVDTCICVRASLYVGWGLGGISQTEAVDFTQREEQSHSKAQR